VVGCTGVGSYTLCWVILEMVVLHSGGMYRSWLLYSVVGCTGVGCFTLWWDILDLVVLQYGGIDWSW
jgi:hypothetical protein